MGGKHFIECNSAAKDIWQFSIEKEIWILAALIPEKNNTQADRGGTAKARHISTSKRNNK